MMKRGEAGMGFSQEKTTHQTIAPVKPQDLLRATGLTGLSH